MRNEWFFKWHFIGRDGPTEIDSFDGRALRYGGIKFLGSARDVYWATLVRYLRKKIDSVFTECEFVISTYPLISAEAVINDVEREMDVFVAGVGQDALEKDRILRGDGINFPSPDQAALRRLLLVNDTKERADALRRHLQALNANAVPTPKQQKDSILILRPTIWGMGIDLKSVWVRISHLLRRRREA